MPNTTIPVRFIYRSQSMVPLLNVAQYGGLWDQERIDVRDFRFSADALAPEELLFEDKIDFIFGNHISPYMRLAHGHPMVCLAQTESWFEVWVATRSDINSVSELQGKRIVSPRIVEDGEFCGHSDGNRLLQLQLHGIDLEQIQYVNPKGVSNEAELVREHQADACFVAPDRLRDAQQAGLKIHELPILPMVHNVTLTTSIPRLERDDLAERVIRIMLSAVHIMKTQKAQVLEWCENPVGAYRPGQLERFKSHYDQIVRDDYDDKLYPQAEAIANAHKLACLVYPEAKKINPLELWDLHTLKQVHRSGYAQRLTQAPASVA